jgi:hypothetical protein
MVIFDSALADVNFSATIASFGLGLLPAPAPVQKDNVTPRHVVSAADLDEQTAYSIAQTIREEMISGIMDRIVEADHDEVLERLAEQAEMDARLDSITS